MVAINSSLQDNKSKSSASVRPWWAAHKYLGIKQQASYNLAVYTKLSSASLSSKLFFNVTDKPVESIFPTSSQYAFLFSVCSTYCQGTLLYQVSDPWCVYVSSSVSPLPPYYCQFAKYNLIYTKFRRTSHLDIKQEEWPRTGRSSSIISRRCHHWVPHQCGWLRLIDWFEILNKWQQQWRRMNYQMCVNLRNQTHQAQQHMENISEFWI